MLKPFVTMCRPDLKDPVQKISPKKTGPRGADTDSTSRYHRIDGVQDKKLACCWNTTVTAIPSL